MVKYCHVVCIHLHMWCVNEKIICKIRSFHMRISTLIKVWDSLLHLQLAKGCQNTLHTVNSFGHVIGQRIKSHKTVLFLFIELTNPNSFKFIRFWIICKIRPKNFNLHIKFSELLWATNYWSKQLNLHILKITIKIFFLYLKYSWILRNLQKSKCI